MAFPLLAIAFPILAAFMAIVIVFPIVAAVMVPVILVAAPLVILVTYGEQLGCPECLEVHRLSKIKAWVSDTSPPNPPSDLKAGNSGVELSFGLHPDRV